MDGRKINAELESIGLKEVPFAVIDQQQKYIMELLPEVTVKKIKAKRKSKDWLKWMKILDVYELWYLEDKYKDYDVTKAKASKGAKDILYDTKLSLSINALLMKKMTIDAICQSMNIRYQLDLTDLMIKLYRKYFFNPEGLTRHDWKAYLGNCNEWEQHVYFTALTDSLDAVKFEIGLPASINVTDELGFLLKKSLQKSKQHLRGNTPTSAAEARRWIGVTLSLADKYEKYRDADTTDFGNALEMELVHDTGDFTQADEIFGGPSDSDDQDDTADGENDGQPSLPNMGSS